LGLSVETAAAYFPDTAVRTIFMAVVIFVFVHLWHTTYTVTGSTAIAGFSVAQMIWYLVITESIITGRIRYWRNMDEEVRSGQIAYSLNKPVNYLTFHYATFLGESIVKVGANLLVGSVVAIVMVGPISVPLRAAPFVAASMLLGLTVDYMTAAAIGLLAFWVEDTAPFGLIYNCLALILGGTLLPLELFPATLRRVAAALPMNQVVYAPARLLADFSSSQPFSILARQVAWVAVTGCVLSCVFHLGRRRLDVNGG
jgi:ABC-2 type transport system permease protein